MKDRDLTTILLAKLAGTKVWMANYEPEPATEAVNFITQNAVRTPDGTYLVSGHTHDFRYHIDANSLYYMRDGGYDYIRSNPDYIGDECKGEDLTLMSDDPFELVREKLLWGSYGKSGKEPLHYIRLKDMEEDHIANVIEYLNAHHVGSPVAKWRIEMMREELKYRKIKLIGE